MLKMFPGFLLSENEIIQKVLLPNFSLRWIKMQVMNIESMLREMNWLEPNCPVLLSDFQNATIFSVYFGKIENSFHHLSHSDYGIDYI
jgi:hypothetical protein